MSEQTSPGITFMLQYTEANSGYVDYTNRSEAVSINNELALTKDQKTFEDITEEQLVSIQETVPEQKLNFKEYIDYMNRSYATEKQNEDVTAIFNQESNYLQRGKISELKQNLEEAYKNNSLLWQGVISFDNSFLESQGLYDKATGQVDQQAIKNVIRDAMPKMIEKAIIAQSGLSPVGEFYVWVAKDSQAFYKAYVQKGLDITYNLSFKVNQSFTEGDIVNGVAQIDFGNGYLGNLVVNDLPKPEVHKDVLDKEDGKSINNGTVKLGDEVTYKLEGWVVPADRSYDLFEYKFVDQLQQTHDLYLKDSVVAKVDITLSDGTVIAKGSNLAQYTETVYNKETGRYELAFKKDFLAKVVRSSEFGADAFLVVKRIKAGDVYNTTDLFVNGYKVKSETVVTHTPETPKPVEPQKATPKAPAKGLPQTGEASVAPLTAIGAIILSALGLLGFKKRKEN